MKKEVLGKCPVCENQLHVTKLSCNRCNTSIQGSFSLCKFCKLTHDEKNFIEIFIKSRGNIKEIEKEMGISYPTVRGKLEGVIQALGYDSKYKEPKINQQKILDELSKGDITPDQALKLLQGEN